MDPFTYEFYNPWFQRNHDPPVNYKGNYSTDLCTSKSLAFIDDAVGTGKPFFMGIAPIAPHSQFHFPGGVDSEGYAIVEAIPPQPAERHKNLFIDVVVPRTPHFNPDEVSLSASASSVVSSMFLMKPGPSHPGLTGSNNFRC